jgi:hypothetical protein
MICLVSVLNPALFLRRSSSRTPTSFEAARLVKVNGVLWEQTTRDLLFDLIHACRTMRCSCPPYAVSLDPRPSSIVAIAQVWESIHLHFLTSDYGSLDASGDFEPTGIYMGLVGARFEVERVMEYDHMFITESNTTVCECQSGLT